MNHYHLKIDVIQPVLNAMGMYSRAAEELLLLTCAQESHGAEYLHQINGPALGIYQMEPRTHDDIWDNYLRYKDELSDTISGYVVTRHFRQADQMKGNLYYATAMARVFYLRFSESLPEADDIEGLAKYYKKYYNTPKGAATVEQAISNYERFMK